MSINFQRYTVVVTVRYLHNFLHIFKYVKLHIQVHYFTGEIYLLLNQSFLPHIPAYSYHLAVRHGVIHETKRQVDFYSFFSRAVTKPHSSGSDQNEYKFLHIGYFWIRPCIITFLSINVVWKHWYAWHALNNDLTDLHLYL